MKSNLKSNPEPYDFISWDLLHLWGLTLPGGALLLDKPNAPKRHPWAEAEEAETDSTLWNAILASAISATRRWEGSGPVGVRVWLVDADGYLCSYVESVRWTQPMRAKCKRIDELHTAPEPTCWCGLYAMRPEAATSLFDGPGDHWFAVGVISLYGRVMSHRHGWRAEYARIREVWWVADGPTPRTDLYHGVTWHLVERW